MFHVDPQATPKTDYASHRPLRLVAAGRLVRRKNFALIIETLARLRDTLDVSLDIFGEGTERARLEKQIERLELGSAVRLHGYAARWYAEGATINADIFVNLSDTEGFCIVVAEAMAIGLPVIATDVGGIRDYGREGTNMLKLAGVDGEALARALHKLAEDEALRRRLGKTAHADMMRQFNPQTLRQRGQEVLAGATPRRAKKA
ncbi:MAG: glycosyltransferase [Hyphomicrobiales bacterium]|nr:glycosyltransferase [Hyphomicrobiales bacterium]